jgi:hypothetical protein
MAVIAIPGGSDNDATDDSTGAATTSGDGALTWLFGAAGIGSGYGVAATMNPPVSTQVAGTLGDLQSGSTGISAAGLSSAYQTTLGSVVAQASGNSAPNTTGMGAYKAPDGKIYTTGTGPGRGATTGTAAASRVPGGTLFWLLAVGAAALFLKERR